MKLVRGGMKAPLYTDWVTVVDIGATGTAATESGSILVPYGDLELAEPPTLDIRFTINMVAGSGTARGWARLYNAQGFAAVSDGSAASNVSMGTALVSSGSETITVQYKPGFFNPRNAASSNNMWCTVKGVGSAADTEWTITDIKARIIYIPL